ncbi:MAG: site-specific integrase [Clostridiaceae bacterium]|nr:site-specific integrase [Clostridiaceae bacterium]
MEFVQPIRDKKQIAAIKIYLKGTNFRDYCLFTLGNNSALRISDLLKLKIGDVIDEKKKVKDRIQIKEKKTGKDKNFPIGDNAKKAVSEYLATRGEYSFNDPLFISRKGDKASLQRDQAYKIINQAARAVGITERIGSHTMRKTFAYQAYQSGIDLTLIQKLLNHSAPSVTLAYIGITQDQMDDVYLNLNL